MDLKLNERPQKDMYDQFVGPTRTHASWKPRVIDTPLTFLHCKECGRVFLQEDSGTPIENPGKGRDRISILPYVPPTAENAVSCCGKPMEVLPVLEWDEVAEHIEFEHETRGGVNMNCLVVHWEVEEEGYEPRWVCLKTFTGHQTKYITPDKRSPLIFALADEDAFTYCHKNPCPECVFRCKTGFEIYVYVPKLGICHSDMTRILTEKLHSL